MHDKIPDIEHGKPFPFPVRAVPGSRLYRLLIPNTYLYKLIIRVFFWVDKQFFYICNLFYGKIKKNGWQ